MLNRLAYSAKETQALLGLGNTKFYELVKTQKLKTAKIGRKTVVLASELQAFLERISCSAQ